jgi:ADP-ribose pyrophosphatase
LERILVDIAIVSSEIVYHGQVFDVRQDQLRLPNGNLAKIDVVDHGGAVTMIPVDSQGRIWFVRQYRHAIKKVLLELPAGAAEIGETPLTSAQRELREETGMAAGILQEIGSFYLAPGYSSEFMHIFLASDLQPAPLPADEDEYFTIEKVPARQAVRLAETGKLEDSKSLIALFWSRPHLVHLGLID